MIRPFEEQYFKWLCAKVFRNRPTSPSLTFWKLFRHLHTTEFVWLVMGDDNRAADGIYLRYYYTLAANIEDVDLHWRDEIPCSCLEMFIAFAKRAEFQTGDSVYDWFWEFMTNLGLNEFNDANFDQNTVDDILEEFIWRLYDSNGHGGMFPMHYRTDFDQSKIEIWNQFAAYLIDQNRLPF